MIRVPYYIGDPKTDPNLENHPYDRAEEQKSRSSHCHGMTCLMPTNCTYGSGRYFEEPELQEKKLNSRPLSVTSPRGSRFQ